jgi:hypothetical protein
MEHILGLRIRNKCLNLRTQQMRITYGFFYTFLFLRFAIAPLSLFGAGNIHNALLFKKADHIGTDSLRLARTTDKTNEGRTQHWKRRSNKPERIFFLQNTLNGKKQIVVSNKRVQLQVNESQMSGEQLSRFNNIECTFDSIVGDSLVITLITEDVDVDYRNRFVNISTNYYAGKFNRVYKTIALADIMYLNIKNPFRQALTNIGSGIMALSILTIVGSPFAGLSLEGEARATMRNQVFITGVSGFLVSIPFFIVGKNKKYGLSPLYPTKKKNYWLLKERWD